MGSLLPEDDSDHDSIWRTVFRHHHQSDVASIWIPYASYRLRTFCRIHILNAFLPMLINHTHFRKVLFLLPSLSLTYSSFCAGLSDWGVSINTSRKRLKGSNGRRSGRKQANRHLNICSQKMQISSKNTYESRFKNLQRFHLASSKGRRGKCQWLATQQPQKRPMLYEPTIIRRSASEQSLGLSTTLGLTELTSP